LKISEKSKDTESIKECYGLLAELYRLAGDKEQSLVYFNKFQGLTSDYQVDIRHGYTPDISESDTQNEQGSSVNVSKTSSNSKTKQADTNVAESASNVETPIGSVADSTLMVNVDNLELLRKKKQKNAIVFGIAFLVSVATMTFVLSRRRHTRRTQRK